MYKYKLEGKVDENLYSSEDNKVKTIRLIDIEDISSNYSFEIVSESNNCNHELIDSLLGKKILIEVKVIE